VLVTRRARCLVPAWALLGVLALGSVAARGHGPSLGVNQVLTWLTAGSGAHEPRLVRLWRGAAWFDRGTLRYHCPARWGGPEAPLMAVSGDAVLVAGERGLFRLDADGGVSAVALPPALEGLTLRALASDGREVAGLTTGGALLSLAPAPPALVTTLAPPADALVVEGGGRWLLATEDRGTLTLFRARRDGDEAVREDPLLTAPYRATPALVWIPGAAEAAGRLWVRGTTSDGYRLDRVELGADGEVAPSLVPVATSSEPIHGPVETRGGTFLVLGGQPHRLVGDDPEPLAETPRLFCLDAAPGGELLACVVGELDRYHPETGVVEPLLTLALLRPPSLEGLDATDTLSCKADWMDAASDAALPPELVDPPEWSRPPPAEPEVAEAEAERAPSAGCASGQGAWPCLALVALAGSRRRRGYGWMRISGDSTSIRSAQLSAELPEHPWR
jgi:hypothetical protein